MSAEKVINALLKADADLAALIGDEIHAGVIPQGTALPAVGYNHISTIERPTVSMGEATTLCTSRIEVAVQAKTYPQQKAVLKAVRKACRAKQGVFAGVTAHSVLVDTIGPDIRDDDAKIFMQTQDFMVAYTEVN